MYDRDDYPGWMTGDMIRASRYTSVRHIRETCARLWCESCYVLRIPGDAPACLGGKWPNINAITA